MSVQWTKQQETAIEKRNKNLLISAAAGAGKTAVLVERIIQRLLDENAPVNVDQLLIVTFTNAAALEMKDRIARALKKKYKIKPQNQHIKRQLLLLDKASICTLHSFCLEVIRKNYFHLQLPYGLTLDPRFRVADEIETTLLKIDVLEEFFEEEYSLQDPNFLRLVENYGGERDDQGLQNLVIRLYELSQSQPHPGAWLEEICFAFSKLSENEKISHLFTQLLVKITGELNEAVDILRQAQRLSVKPGGPKVYLANLEEEILQLDSLVSLIKRGFEEKGEKELGIIFSEVNAVTFGKLKPCRNEVEEQIKLDVQALRNESKKIIQEIQTNFTGRSPEELLQDLAEISPLMETLALLVEGFKERYLKAKFTRNIIDFSDIEHFALRLLLEEGEKIPSPTRLALELKSRFQEVMIDEYQDINSVQDAILQLVARDDRANLFMVGDVKQSIYGFRLAEPSLFLQKYRQYGQAENLCTERILLSQNFRSRDFILNGVNYLFRQIMTPELGGIPYLSEAELVYGACYPPEDSREERRVEVHLIERKDKDQSDYEDVLEKDDLEDLNALQLEARVIAERIKELIKKEKVWDEKQGAYRPVEYQDIVILLRSTKTSAITFLDEFRYLGIPAYAEVGTGYFIAQEIQTMIALLQIIDNPRQDIPLAAVLRSPLVGLSATELTMIRIRRPQGDFYQAVRQTAFQDKSELGLKLKEFQKRLKEWRTYARRHSLVDLISFLYRQTGYFDYVGILPGGVQKQANLQAFHDRAEQYQNTARKGLFSFLRFLERMAEKNGDFGTARALGEKENVVRIMSIHKSKGLEFPIVFVAGMGRLFNQQDFREDILVDKKLGLGPMWVDPQQRLKYPTLAFMSVRDKIKKDFLAEEIRVLYVALTRAKEFLILVGSFQGIVNKLKKYGSVLHSEEKTLPPGLINKANCYWDWLLPCLLRHQDGEQLRKLLNEEKAEVYHDTSGWKLFFWNKRNILSPENVSAPENEENFTKIRRLKMVKVTEHEPSILSKRLNWSYPYKEVANLPAKVTVTEIKNYYQALSQDEFSNPVFLRQHFSKRPQFLQEEGLSASEIGSALHLVMRHLELNPSFSVSSLQEEIAKLVDREILTQQQSEAVSAQSICAFLLSPVGQRLIKSKRVLREVPFTYALAPHDIFPSDKESGEEKILLQGTIDCLFEEKDGFVLIDYKTDQVFRETIHVLQKQYEIQLKLYAQAVEKIFNQPVQEKIIYFFHINEALVYHL